jgi:hypothetical protein
LKSIFLIIKTIKKGIKFMAKNANFVSHKKSKLKENGGPKLPLAADLVEGEIAINFGKDVETLSIKNESGTVVTFSSDNYYTEEKLGSGFTGENSAKTVTDVIEENELVTSTALNDLNGKMVAEIESSNGSITTSTSTRSDGSVKTDIQTDASKISGLTAVSDSDEGAAKISGVTSTDSIRKGVENIYKSLASEIAARKAALLARTISSANKGITVTETPNADGYSTTLTLTLDASTNGTGKEKTGNDNALAITENGLFLSSNWTCGEYNN